MFNPDHQELPPWPLPYNPCLPIHSWVLLYNLAVQLLLPTQEKSRKGKDGRRSWALSVLEKSWKGMAESVDQRQAREWISIQWFGGPSGDQKFVVLQHLLFFSFLQIYMCMGMKRLRCQCGTELNHCCGTAAMMEMFHISSCGYWVLKCRYYSWRTEF